MILGFMLVLEHLFFILKVPSGGIAVSAVWMVGGGRGSTDVRWKRPYRLTCFR